MKDIRRILARDRFVMMLAYRLPRRLAYWCAVRVLSAATVGEYAGTVVTDLKALDALERWK